MNKEEIKKLKLNELKDGKWILSEDYKEYQREGGILTPQTWNDIVSLRELGGENE